MTETDRDTIPIARLARENTEFRKVVRTGRHTQLVLMAIPEAAEIGGEVHDDHDQVLVFVEGSGRAQIGDRASTVQAGDLSFVPAGTWHNFVNTGTEPLKLYTTYSPPEHAPGTDHPSKSDALAEEG